jgi:hypothetical protein
MWADIKEHVIIELAMSFFPEIEYLLQADGSSNFYVIYLDSVSMQILDKVYIDSMGCKPVQVSLASKMQSV